MDQSPGAGIGMLVGSRDSSGALVAADGRVLARVSVPSTATPADGVEGLVGMATLLLRKAQRADVRVDRVGVGFPGVIDPADGSVRGTRFAMRAWRGSPLARMLQERLSLPVTVRNDVVNVMLGEQAAGAAVGEREVVLAYSSTGVGGALLLDGRIRLGRRGAAGHLGHVPAAAAAGLRCSCGGMGHLDSIASAAGVTRWYREQRHLDPADAPHLGAVTQAAARGDAVARAALAIGGSALGRELGGLSNLLEPDVIILAGESARDPYYRDAVEQALVGEIIPGNDAPELRLSALGGDAHLIGAALGVGGAADSGARQQARIGPGS